MEILDFIKEYWHIFMGITGLIYLWVQNAMTTKDQEKRIGELEKQMKEINPLFLDIRERLISIETTLKLHIQNDFNNTKSK